MIGRGRLLPGLECGDEYLARCHVLWYAVNIPERFVIETQERQPPKLMIDVSLQVVLQIFLSSSKGNVFYNRTRVKRAKSVPVFSSRIGLCRDYMLLFDELKNFCNTTGGTSMMGTRCGSGRGKSRGRPLYLCLPHDQPSKKEKRFTCPGG